MREWRVILACLLSQFMLAQTPTEDLELQIESLAEQSEAGSTDLLQLAERLQMLRQNPIRLNFATAEELLQIPYLNIFQVANLLQYREKTGALYSPYELMAIKGFDQVSISKILPYLDFNSREVYPPLKPRQILKYSNHNILLRGSRVLQRRRGFSRESSSPYLGNPNQAYFRYRGTYRQLLSAGLVLQQDAGESLTPPGANARIDHWSGHLALRNFGKLSKLIIGDFHANFGQGLALWSGPAFGKSAEASEIKRYPPGFIPFSGSEENRFLRGIAGSYQLMPGWEISLFYSNHRQDANLLPNPEGSAGKEVSSLQSSGLHRSLAELKDRHSNRLKSLGAHLNFRRHNLSLGITGLHYQLSLPLQAGSQLYQRYRFQGERLSNFAADFNWLYRDLNVFGELATDDDGDLAYTLGLQANPADGVFISLLHRHFSRKYQQLYTAPFAESAESGESGNYLGLKWLLNPSIRLQAYLDLYYFSWPRYQVALPSEGAEFMTQVEVLFNPRLSAYLRYKQELNDYNQNLETPLQSLGRRRRGSTRLHLAYRLSDFISLATRVEHSQYQLGRENYQGLLLYQDIKYRFQKLPLHLSCRYALSEVEDYQARIYAYENDLSYSFSIPPYYGRALKFYILTAYQLKKGTELQLRYSHQRFFDRQNIGSGNQQISGPLISEVKIQLRCKL